MRHIVKNENNELMILVATKNTLFIPGIEVLGLASELNPEDKDLSTLSWDGEALSEDSSKVSNTRQAKANANLDKIRMLRAPLLDESDKKINTLEDDSLDTSAWRVYRKALRECTESLKKVNGDAKLLCEDLVAEEFEFPSKPE